VRKLGLEKVSVNGTNRHTYIHQYSNDKGHEKLGKFLEFIIWLSICRFKKHIPKKNCIGTSLFFNNYIIIFPTYQHGYEKEI
jgi:hypothetical protein